MFDENLSVMSAAIDEQVRELLERERALGELPAGAGVAVSVVARGESTFSGTYGLRDRERGLPVTPQTVFEIASLTKAFTSIAYVLAGARGFVDIDRPLNHPVTLLPFSDSSISNEISLADILSHRSGLTSNDLLWYFGSPHAKDLTRAVASLPLVPGAFRRTFIYSNILYGVIGTLFEKLVGERWESYLSREILAPLGMTSTSFRPAIAEDDVAMPYVGRERVARVDMTTVAAAGAMRASLADMTRWLRFWLDGTRRATLGMSVSSVDIVHREHVVVDSPNAVILKGFDWLSQEVGYGLGWFLGRASGRRIAYHTGFIDGFSAALLLDLDESTGFVVLTNLNHSSLPGHLIRHLWAGPPRGEPSNSGAAIGTYRNPVWGEISVVLRGEHLVLSYNGNHWRLYWSSANSADFVMTMFGLPVRLSAVFGEQFSSHDRFAQVSIPFAMDSRMDPCVFKRC